MKDFTNYSLLNHNTFGIDAACHRFIEYETTEEACRAAEIIGSGNAPLLIVGSGSNLLLTKDFNGTVVHSAIKGIHLININKQGDVFLRCGSGETWDDVVAHCVSNGYYGAENLSLIPGEVGASAVQNIGAYGSEVACLIESIEAVDIQSKQQVVIACEECHYGYRQSRFKGEWHNRFLITHVTYRLSTTFQPKLDYGNIRTALAEKGIETPTAQQLRQIIINIREAKLPNPKVLGNAGSFFMNPVVSIEKYSELAASYPGMPHYPIDASHEKIPAGWLIEQCGWKGRSLGPAGVHNRQALVLVNHGQATGQEILHLCETIQNDVEAKFGIHINPEVNII